METLIRGATEGDADNLARIYNHYILNTCVTFETDPVDAADIAECIAATSAIPLPWLVAESSGEMVGYAYTSEWQGRCAYRFSVESTIYLDVQHTGHGFGTKLYSALIDSVRATSLHSMIGGISLPNEGSIKLHERLGFKKIGHFEEVGYKQDRWVDVGYWQLML